MHTMSAFNKKYFTVEGSLSYKKMLKHFKEQAGGGHSVILISNASKSDDLRTRFNRPSVTGGVVLIDMADDAEKSNKKKRSDELPKVEMVDPTEADRRRALDKLAEEQHDKRLAQGASSTHGNIKGNGKGKNGQSAKSNSAGTNGGKRKQSQVNRVVKKTKELFDD